MERITKIINGYAHGAEGVSDDELTGNYCRGEFEATAIVERLAEYEAIGTVEECRAAVEKQKAMKPNDIKNSVIGIMYGYCPTCRRQINVNSSENYCIGCGQKLDWESDVGNEVN